jgi:hypothetical protein
VEQMRDRARLFDQYILIFLFIAVKNQAEGDNLSGL